MNKKTKELYKAKANVYKALGHPTRLWIVEELSKGERCVCEFVKEIDADFSTISKHLNLLKQAGIVEDEKRGLNVYYKLKVPCIMNSMSCVHAVLESKLQDQLDYIK